MGARGPALPCLPFCEIRGGQPNTSRRFAATYHHKIHGCVYSVDTSALSQYPAQEGEAEQLRRWRKHAACLSSTPRTKYRLKTTCTVPAALPSVSWMNSAASCQLFSQQPGWKETEKAALG